MESRPSSPSLTSCVGRWRNNRRLEEALAGGIGVNYVIDP